MKKSLESKFNKACNDYRMIEGCYCFIQATHT